MKKIFLLLTALSILFTFVACGESDPATDTPGSKTDIVAVTPSETNGETSSATNTDSNIVSADSGTESVSEDTDTQINSASTDSDTNEATGSTENRPTSDTSTDTKTDTSTDKTTNTSKPTDTSTSTSTSASTTTSTVTSKPTVSTSSTNATPDDDTQDGETPEEYKPFTEITPENYYGKTWLKKQPYADTLIAAYESIVTAASDMETSAGFHKPLTEDQLKIVWGCYRNDYPQQFWLESGYSYTISGRDVKSLTFIYTMSKDQKNTAEAKLNAAVEELLKDLHGGMNQFKLEKALHDRLVLSCTYTETSHAHDAYGALVEKKAVCEGYARAFQLLCRKVGIHALIAEGAAINPADNSTVGHAWNVVQINGDYYHLDSTWDDAGEPSQEEAIHYAWFNVTTAQILEDHAIQIHGYDLPLCTSQKENYFRKTGKYLNKLTVEGLRSQLKEKDGSYYAHIFIEEYANAKDWITQNIKAITSGIIRGGCQYSIQTTGHGLYLIITPA